MSQQAPPPATSTTTSAGDGDSRRHQRFEVLLACLAGLFGLAGSALGYFGGLQVNHDTSSASAEQARNDYLRTARREAYSKFLLATIRSKYVERAATRAAVLQTPGYAQLIESAHQRTSEFQLAYANVYIVATDSKVLQSSASLNEQVLAADCILRQPHIAYSQQYTRQGKTYRVTGVLRAIAEGQESFALAAQNDITQ